MMKVTRISVQARDPSRVNVFIDGKYRFSLDIMQVASLGIKTNVEYSDQQIADFEQEGVFGKIYTRALEYSLVRPRSEREVADYLYKKTLDTRTKTGSIKKGASKEVVARVFNSLVDKGYVDDEKFARFWVENRNQRKGVSARKLRSELASKGVSRDIVDQAMSSTDRTDSEEIAKIIAKKRSKYPDQQKLIAYLARQGFSYDDIKQALNEED